jgi:hypothetical protein
MTKTKSLKNLETKKNLIPILKAISKMNVTDFCHSLNNLNDSSVDGICECVYNVIFNDLKLSPRKRNALKKHLKTKCSIEDIKKITSKSHPISKRRKLLKQQGAGLPMLLMTAVPFLIDLVKSAFSPK